MNSDNYECIECGCIFTVVFEHEDTEDEVMYCPNCGSELEDELDESFYEDEDEL